MSPAQQPLAPPVRVLHPVPPHVPHDDKQQTVLPDWTVLIPVKHVGSDCWYAVTTHGGLLIEHDLLAVRMSPVQQLLAPPVRVLHPVPPHVPHDDAQQTVLPD